MRYQRKYWLVQTLLKVTKAKVWTSRVAGRSCLASARGRRRVERRSCGMNARREKSKNSPVPEGLAERAEDR